MQSVRATPGAVNSKRKSEQGGDFLTYGWIPEWPKGADCKSVSNAFGGSNPPPSISLFISGVVLRMTTIAG